MASEGPQRITEKYYGVYLPSYTIYLFAINLSIWHTTCNLSTVLIHLWWSCLTDGCCCTDIKVFLLPIAYSSSYVRVTGDQIFRVHPKLLWREKYLCTACCQLAFPSRTSIPIKVLAHHTAPEWCQPEMFATLSFSPVLIVCDQDKNFYVGQQIF